MMASLSPPPLLPYTFLYPSWLSSKKLFTITMTNSVNNANASSNHRFVFFLEPLRQRDTEMPVMNTTLKPLPRLSDLEGTIHMAAYSGNLALCTMRLKQGLVKVSSLDGDKRTPVHWACAGGHTNILRMLLGHLESKEERTRIIDQQDDGGWSPLMSAVSAGHIEVVKELLSHNCDCNICNDNDQIALHYVKKDENIASLLIPNTSDINKFSKRGKATPLIKSVMLGATGVVKLFLSTGRCKINFQDFWGNTALHYAYNEGCQEIVKLLEKNGSSITILNRDKKLPKDMKN